MGLPESLSLLRLMTSRGTAEASRRIASERSEALRRTAEIAGRKSGAETREALLEALRRRMQKPKKPTRQQVSRLAAILQRAQEAVRQGRSLRQAFAT